MSARPSYLLRVRLPDRPGTLGQVASALGVTGADIESIVVVDRLAGQAVDDLLVTLPPGALADALVTAACSVDGVAVESLRRHHGRVSAADDLSLLDLAASVEQPLHALVDGLPDLVHASYALLVDGPPAAGVVRHGSPAAPASRTRLDWLPIDAPRVIAAEEVWADAGAAGPDCELVAVPADGGRAVVLGRIGGPSFRPAELLRLAHLVTIAASAGRPTTAG